MYPPAWLVSNLTWGEGKQSNRTNFLQTTFQKTGSPYDFYLILVDKYR